ncbi:MAG: fimbria/pilus periplasmic chaperone [Candidatus Tyrphobacter sp.]
MLHALVAAVNLRPAAPPPLPRWHISTSGLTIPAGRLATDFTVVNDDRVRERFEVSASSWSQANGTDVRRPDRSDVLIFPRLVEIEPGRSVRVRVGVLQGSPDVETAYRIAIEQLFDPRHGRPGLHFLLAYDVPLFVAPQRAVVDARVVRLTARSGRLHIAIRNDGTLHAFARAIRVTWRGHAEIARGPFYVLAKSEATFALSIRGCGTGIAAVAPDPRSEIAPLDVSLQIACHRSDERRIVSLRLNGVSAGDAVVIVRVGDILVRASDVEGIPFPRRPREERISGEPFLSLASSGARYAFDPAAPALDILYAVVTHRRVVVAVPPAPPYSNGTSAAFSYAGSFERGLSARLSETATFAMPDARFEAVFENDARAAPLRTQLDGQIYERDGDGEIDLGDQRLAAGGELPALPLFGVGFARGDGIAASARRAPFERVSGVLTNPARITIDVASAPPIDVLVQPGTFSIDGVPASATVRAVDLVTNLPLRVLRSPPLDPGLLAPAWRVLHAAAGTLRTCVYECARYAGFVAGASLLSGDSLWLASGPNVEALGGALAAGYDLIAAGPNRALRLSVAAGRLGGMLCSYDQRLGRLQVWAGFASSGAPEYSGDGTLLAVGRALSSSLGVAYGNARFLYEEQAYRNASGTARYDLVDEVPLLRSVVRFDLGDRIATGDRGRVFLRVLLALRIARLRQTTLLGETIGSRDGPAAFAASQIDMPSGFTLAAGANGSVAGTYGTDAVEVTASTDGNLEFSGAFAFLHGVHAVRSIENGYAVVIGEPGDLVVDGDGRVHPLGSVVGGAFPLPASASATGLAYAQRHTSIDDTATLSTASVRPAPGAGALVIVSHARLFAVIGRLADPIWRFGEIVLDNGASSPVGSDGLFYFERLSPGRYRAHVVGARGACAATIVVPQSHSRQIDLGEVSCSVNRCVCGARADPRRARNIEEASHRVERARILGTLRDERLPGRVAPAQRITAAFETIASALEVFPLDTGRQRLPLDA